MCQLGHRRGPEDIDTPNSKEGSSPEIVLNLGAFLSIFTEY